jgi:hypothetical protein
MKRIIAGLAGSLVVASTLHAAESSGARSSARVSHEVGRYQLFQGEYTTYDLKKQQTYTHHAVFHIDTETGRVLRYVNKIDEDGKYIESWVATELPSLKKKK